MTKAACHLILHYGIARLSWRTVKSLRRSRRDAKQTNDDVSPVEWEILQGWTIVAFHSMYVSGIEYFVRFIVPFYFHLKMIVLVATFVIPSWVGRKNGRAGEGEVGLSPFISYWFDYLIVPGVHRVHELMDNNPKQWAINQCLMMPLTFIDYFIIPGILATDEEKQLIRKIRSESRMRGRDKAPPSEAFPPQIARISTNTISEECFDQPVMPDEQTASRENNDDSQYAAIDVEKEEIQPAEQQATKVATEEEESQQTAEQRDATISDIEEEESTGQQDATMDIEEKESDETDESGYDNFLAVLQSPPSHLNDEQHDSERIHRTPPRHHETSTLFNESTPNRTPTATSLFPRTTPTRTLSPNRSLLSPKMKSRLVSSAMRLRRFSPREPRNNNGGLFSPDTTPRRGGKVSNANIDEESTATAMLDRRMDGLTPEKGSNKEDEMQSSARKTRRRRERPSFGDRFRELVTGDPNIRVRDHLFDLDLPSSPSLRPRTRQNNKSPVCLCPGYCYMHANQSNTNDATTNRIGASNVTTRRSSRLAKKKAKG